MSCKATANAMTVNSNNVNNSELVRESESEIVCEREGQLYN